ncbi:MAG: hypothetical protein KO463_03645 [Candidatus Methanofastidiosa archaeon]|nr:hypothetical protein [Candidatus Methanofastidiosa archaeon]
MRLELTTWQRLMLDKIVGALEGNVDTIYKASRVLDAVRMTEAETEAVCLRREGELLRWEDAERRWEIEIPDGALADWLTATVQAFRGWPAAEALQVLDLMEQLGVEVEAL